LQGKWFRRYDTVREALLRPVVEAKYDSMSGGWCFKEVERPFGV